jgi:hypothetical protein
MGKLFGVLGVGILLVVLTQGCAMFRAWKEIPPPGGCDQCHTVPISANWTIAYKVVTLNDESGKLSFQTEQSTMQPSAQKGMSKLDLRKTEEQKCFECHQAPNQAHKDKAGRFHH